MPKTQRMTHHHNELPKSNGRAFRVWRAILWRLMAMQLLFMVVIIFSSEYFLIGYPLLRQAIATLTLIGVFPFGYLALRMVLNKNFGEFRLSLAQLTADDEAEAQETPLPQNDEKPH